jgi:hypothetical protein
MKKLLALGIILTVSAPVYAQKNSDIKRLENQKQKKLQALVKSTNHFNQDMNAKYSCFPDYQRPFEILRDAVVNKVDLATEATEVLFDTLINGNDNDGLAAMVQDLDKYKLLKKKEKNKFRRRSLKKIIKQKKQQISDMATLIVRDSSDEYREIVKDTITLGGLTSLAMKENASNVSVVNIFRESESLTNVDGRSMSDIYNSRLSTLMDSCQTASCVYLVSGDIKQWYADSFKINSTVKIISKKSIEALKAYRMGKIFKKLDELSQDLAKRKPIGDVSDECLPTPPEPQPVPGDGSDDDSGDIPSDDLDVGSDLD